MRSKSFVSLTFVTLVLVLANLAAAQAPVGGSAAPLPSDTVLSSSSELPGPSAGPPAPPAEKVVQLPPGVIALVNGQPISEKEWTDTCKRVAGPSILQVMIRHKVVQEAAEAKGIKLSDADAQAEYDKAVAKAGGPDQLLANLADSGESEEDFKNRLRTEALLNKLVEKDVTISDEEVKKVYLERYGRKTEVQVIATQTQPDAEAVVKQAREGKDFALLAAELSIDDLTARNHGYLPVFLTDGFFPKPFGRIVITESVAQMLFNMKPGEMSNPITAGESGFYIFKVNYQEPAKSVAFETVKDELRQMAREAKTARIASERLNELLQKADIRVGIKTQ